MSVADSTEPALPDWARVSEERKRHLTRVTALLDGWAAALAVSDEERRHWHDAGRLHDALRDAPPGELRALVRDPSLPDDALHGPAAACRLAEDGERRADVLDAIRWHTLGSASWRRTGRALYMADYLDPGRRFARADRAFLATQVPVAFDAVFRQVVRRRLEGALRDGLELHSLSVELWNSVR